MELPENEAHVWFFNVDDFLKDIKSYASCLSEEEILRSNKFKFDKDRIIYILARGSLRILSGYYLGHGPKGIEFTYGTHGKPDYNCSTKIKFNISHSGKLIVLGFVKTYVIGLDIERIKTDFDVLNIAEIFFSITEIKMLYDLRQDDLYKAFYRCWTRKESFIKAEGSGLSFPLDSFSVSLDDDKNAKLLETRWNASERNKWSLFSFSPAKDYIGAIAVKGKINDVKYYNWDGVAE